MLLQVNIDWLDDVTIMETLSALLTLCDTITGGFPLQRVSNVDLLPFLGFQPEQADEQTVKLPFIRDTLTPL